MLSKYTQLYEGYQRYKQLHKNEKDDSEIFRSSYLNYLRELLFIPERRLKKLGLSRKVLESEHTLECLH